VGRGEAGGENPNDEIRMIEFLVNSLSCISSRPSRLRGEMHFNREDAPCRNQRKRTGRDAKGNQGIKVGAGRVLLSVIRASGLRKTPTLALPLSTWGGETL
jgi:hypothetical protein